MGDGPGHTEATPSLSDDENHVHPFVSTLPLPYRAEWLHDLPRILFSLLTNNYYCSLVAVAVLLFLLQRWRNRNLPPGPWGIPFYGNLNYLLHLPHLQLSHLREVYGDVYSFKAGCRRIVVLCSFEAIMEGLVYKKDALSCRPELDSYNSLYQGGRQCGLCTSDVTEQYLLRKHFANSAIDAYCSAAARIEDKLSSEIVDIINYFSELQRPFDPAPVLEMACLNVSLSLTFSQRFDPAGRVAKEMWRTFEHRSSVYSFNAVDFLPLLNVFTTDDHPEYIRARSGDQVELHRRFLNFHKDTYDPSRPRDFTDQLLFFLESGEERGLFQPEDIDNILLDMVGNGFQAVAVTLAWLLGYMALNQDIQSEVHEEIDEVVGRDRLPCLDDQPYLPLTAAVIYEVQRLSSIKPFLIPHAARATTFIQGFEVPAGSIVLFNVWSLHHDARYWTNPGKFDPKRFLTEDNVLDIPDHFLPYGAGSRQCPGESLADVELFLFFANVMHQLRVTPAHPAFRLDSSTYDHVLRPKPFEICVKERD